VEPAQHERGEGLALLEVSELPELKGLRGDQNEGAHQDGSADQNQHDGDEPPRWAPQIEHPPQFEAYAEGHALGDGAPKKPKFVVSRRTME
jgi:hypothetical protein